MNDPVAICIYLRTTNTNVLDLLYEHFLNNDLIFSLILRSDIDTLQFQLTFEIPRIQVKAQYRSSGVLILVKASGAGDYWGEYGEFNNINL